MSGCEDIKVILRTLAEYNCKGRVLMNPFVGDDVKNGSSLFLIGESHYLPRESDCDVSPETWYAGNTVLDDQASGYLETDALIRDEFLRNGDFNHKPYRIWKNSAEAINVGGLQLQTSDEDSYATIIRRIFSHIVFFNYFRRPARITGGSLEVEQIDYDVAKAHLDYMIEQFKPGAIIVVSKKAGLGVAIRKDDSLPWWWYYNETPIVVTAHPGCKWWNKGVKGYGEWLGKDECISGKILLQEFIARIAPSFGWMRNGGKS